MTIKLNNYNFKEIGAIIICLSSLAMTLVGCKSSNNDSSADSSTKIDYANPLPANITLFNSNANFTVQASNISTASIDNKPSDRDQHVTTTVDANPTEGLLNEASTLLCYARGNYQQDKLDADPYIVENIITDEVKECFERNGMSDKEIKQAELDSAPVIYKLFPYKENDNLIVELAAYTVNGEESLAYLTKFTIYQSPSDAKPFGSWRFDRIDIEGNRAYLVVDTLDNITTLHFFYHEGPEEIYDTLAVAITKNHDTEEIKFIADYKYKKDKKDNDLPMDDDHEGSVILKAVANNKSLYGKSESPVESYEEKTSCYDTAVYDDPIIEFVLFESDNSYYTGLYVPFDLVDSVAIPEDSFYSYNGIMHVSAEPEDDYYASLVGAADNSILVEGYYLKKAYVYNQYKEEKDLESCTEDDLSFDAMPDLPTSDGLLAPD